MREIATSRGGALLSQAPASTVSISSITVKSAASALSEIWTRTVAWEGSLVKPTCRCACQERAAIWTDVPAISMQALGPAKNSPRANRATIASGTTEARIFKRNMTRYSLTISPRQGAYGWQRVKETSYRRVDAGCFLLARHPRREWLAMTWKQFRDLAAHCARGLHVHFPSLKSEQLCRSSPAIGRPQGWRWRAPAYGGYGLDPARSPVCWLCKRSVEDRAR